MVDGIGEELPIHIGILAIQGGFFEHKASLVRVAKGPDQYGLDLQHKRLKLEVNEVRESKDITFLDGLIIPGGESTSMGKVLERNGFAEIIKDWMNNGERVVWGTCAGMIMLANNLQGTKVGGQKHIGGLDVTVSRNFFGRQINSFEALIDIKESMWPWKPSTTESDEDKQCHGVFIRAPAVVSCDSDQVQVLGTVKHSEKSESPIVVAVKQVFLSIYPSQLTVEKANKSDHLASYLDFTVMIDSGGKLSTRLYEK